MAATHFERNKQSKVYMIMKTNFTRRSAFLFQADGARDLTKPESAMFWLGYDGRTLDGHPWSEQEEKTEGYAIWAAGRDCRAKMFMEKVLPLRLPDLQLEPPRPPHYLTRQLGKYERPVPLPANLHEIMVGPFTVRLRRKDGYTLFTCDVLGVRITKQISYPSLRQLTYDMGRNAELMAKHGAEVARLWEQILALSSRQEQRCAA